MNFKILEKTTSGQHMLWIPSLILLTTSMVFSACKPPETSQRSRIGGKGSAVMGSDDAKASSGKAGKSGKNEDLSDAEDAKGDGSTKGNSSSNSNPDESSSTSTTSTTGTPGNQTPSPTPTPEDTSYPTLYFKGKGTITNNGKNYASSAEITTSIDESKLTNNVTAVRFIVPDHQDKADKKAADSAGARVFSRPTVTDIKNLSGFNNASFTLYTNSTLKKGVTSTLSYPLPMFPRPGKRTAFSALDGGPLVWTTKINGINNATMIVTKVNESSTRLSIKYSLTIDGDVRGELYGAFPISKEAVYEMDTENSRIVSITMTDWWKNTDDNKRENGTTLYKLCKQVKSGKTDTFPCD